MNSSINIMNNYIKEYLDYFISNMKPTLRQLTASSNSVSSNLLQFSNFVFSLSVDSIASSTNSVDLTNCMPSLTKDYPETDLVITKTFAPSAEFSSFLNYSKNNNTLYLANPPAEVTAFFKGRQLNINNYCKLADIGVTYTIDSSLVNKSSINSLLSQGINPFNSSDPIFTDKCTSLTINGSDSTLAMRKSEILQNATEICGAPEGKICIVIGYSDQGQIQCKCNPKESDNIFANSFNLYESSNLPIMNCYYRLAEIVYN